MRYLPASVSRWTTNQSLVVITTPLQEYAVWVHLSWRTIPLGETSVKALVKFYQEAVLKWGNFYPVKMGIIALVFCSGQVDLG
jgi:hypothetical protein